jgi:hypothetical protein
LEHQQKMLRISSIKLKKKELRNLSRLASSIADIEDSLKSEILTENNSEVTFIYDKEILGSASNRIVYTRILHRKLTGVKANDSHQWNDLTLSLQESANSLHNDVDDILLRQACHAIIKDKYYESAVCLEKYIGQSPLTSAHLAKLMQDMYIVAGRPDLALKSIVRYPHLFHAINSESRAVFGLLSRGYLEMNMWQSSEEIGRKAYHFTKDLDIRVVNNLLETLIFSGKASEVKSIMEVELGKYNEVAGWCNVLSASASSFIIRGNCTAAYNRLQDIIDHQEELSKNRNDMVIFAMPTLLKITFVFLNILLNLSEEHAQPLDYVYTTLQQQVQTFADHELKSIIESIILASQYLALATNNHSLLENKYDQSRRNQIPLFLQWMQSKPSGPSTSSKQKPINVSESLAILEKEMDQRILQYVQSLPSSYPPSLVEEPPCNIDPWSILHPPSRLETLSPLSRRQAANLLSISIFKFVQQKFSVAANLLSLLHRHDYRELGLPRMERDIVHQLFLEW